MPRRDETNLKIFLPVARGRGLILVMVCLAGTSFLPNLSWAANKDYCVQVDYSAVPALVNYRKITLMVNVGACASVSVTADGSAVTGATYNSSTQTATFTTTGSSIDVTAINWTSGGTGAATKAPLYNNYHWAFSLTFDDNRQSQFDYGVTLLQQHGWRAAEAVVASWANGGGPGQYFMNWTELQQLRSMGWDMLDHSYDHPNPLTCNGSATDIVPEVNNNQTSLVKYFPGYHVTQMVFPYENSSANTCAGYPTTFLLSAECGGGSYNKVDGVQTTFQYQRGGMFGTDDTAWKQLADQTATAATGTTHTWLIEYTHSVSSGSSAAADQYSTNQATLGDLLNHLDTTYGATGNGSLWFAPAGEVRDYLFTRDKAVVTTCSLVTPTPTPSATPTRTWTATSSSTATPTVTRTASMTPTASLTATPSATPTRSFTSTPTSTPSATRTNTPVPPSPTSTYTVTSSSTPTATPTRTYTLTSTTSATPTVTSSFTTTKTNTPTGTPSNTPVNTPSSTPSPTSSFTFTATSTASSTATFTFSPTKTSTPTVTLSPTDSMTPLASLTATPTRSFTPTPTPTGTSTFTFTSTDTDTSTSTLTAAPSSTASQTNTPTGTPSSTPTSTFTHTDSATTTSTPTRTNTLTPTSTHTLPPTATRTATQTATKAGTFTFTPTFSSTPTFSFTPTFTPTITLTPTPTFTKTATPVGNPGVIVFPNPDPGTVVNILPPAFTGIEDVHIVIFTASFRKVLDIHRTLAGGEPAAVELKDNWGHSLADGLYYVLVSVDGQRALTKLLVLH